MLILGIDPGLARVGYGLINCSDEGKEMIDCGIIQTNSDQKECDRLLEIEADLDCLTDKWKPDLAAVEKFFFYRSSTTISVVQARGVIIMCLARLKIPILEFPPMQIKLAVTGYGKASKDDVINAITRELELKRSPHPDDAADALAIALTAFYYQNESH